MKHRKKIKLSENDKKGIRIVAIFLAASVVIGVILAVVYHYKIERIQAGLIQTDTIQDDWLVDDGIIYRPDSSVKSYLFLGVDDVGLNYESYGRGGRTDTLLLLVKKGSELRILEISRDTMTDVDTYDISGDYLSTGQMQINMQYSFGDSPRRSAYLTKKTVSNLLGGIDVNGSIALDMSGIAPVVDALGGITVTMEQDCTYIDPSYSKDAQITMDGQAAERFVRWRGSMTGSNDERMGRQSWFVRQMLEQADEDKLQALLSAAEPYLYTDMTAEELNSLLGCTLEETIRVPGQTQAGALHDEFYVDENALQDILIRLFYIPSGTR